VLHREPRLGRGVGRRVEGVAVVDGGLPLVRGVDGVRHVGELGHCSSPSARRGVGSTVGAGDGAAHQGQHSLRLSAGTLRSHIAREEDSNVALPRLRPLLGLMLTLTVLAELAAVVLSWRLEPAYCARRIPGVL
jgi:hypothetical protein